jgi:hypothetical protein
VGLFCILAGCARKGVSGARLAEANREYEAGQYEQAASLYEALIREGVDDGIVHYNLGNAYFKMQDLGRAIAHYRRAQRLLPRDPDVAANLALARAQTVDRLDSETPGTAATWIEQLLVGWLSLQEAAGVALTLWVLLCVSIGAVILWSRRVFWRAMLGCMIMLTLLGVLSLGLHGYQEEARVSAVVAAKQVQVNSGPGPDYLEVFVLHAGAEVELLEERGGWARVALPGDLQGWLPAQVLAKI